MEDRFVRGFIAGIIAGVLMNIQNILFHLLNLTQLRLLDYASIAIFGNLPRNSLEVVVSEFGELFFSGLLGIIFAYLIVALNSSYYLFKGWFFSITVWFLVFAAGIVFRIPHLVNPDTGSVLTNLIGATIYGLSLPIILAWLDNRLKTK